MLALPPARLDDLDRQITELSAHINAATAQRHALIAEFTRRGGWAGWGVLSCEHWLQLRCGESPSAAREIVRTARALETLPQTAAAFGRGELSESAVRTITRSATPETEDVLLNIAKYGTGAHLTKLCRIYRQVLATCDPSERRTIVDRYLRFRYDDDGSLRISGHFPPDEGELIRQAFNAVLDRLEPTEPVDEPSAVDDVPDPDTVDAPREAHPLDWLLKLDDEEDDVSTPTPDDDDEDESTPRPVSVPLMVEGALYEQRNADVLVSIAESALPSSACSGSNPERYTVVVHVDAATLLGTGLPGARCEFARGVPIAAEIAQMLACDANIVTIVEDAAGNPLDVGRRTRSVRTKLRTALESRDMECRYPECRARTGLHIHHVTAYADDGMTKLTNLIRLCRAHHAKFHAGEYVIESPGPNQFVFRHARGWVIGRAEVSVDSSAPGLESRNAALGLCIDADTCRPQWRGEDCDYSVPIEEMIRRRRLLESAPSPPR